MWRNLAINDFALLFIYYQVIVNNAIVLHKKASKIYKFFCFTGSILFVKSCWNCFCFFYNFIKCNHLIVKNTWWIFPIYKATCSRIPNIIFFEQRQCFFFLFLHLHRHLWLFHFWIKLHFLPSNLHLHLHDICFFNVFIHLFI